VNLKERGSLKIIYSGFCAATQVGLIPLILLVGAGRFELPTPCAQDGFPQTTKVACFQCIRFQADTGGALKLVELLGTRRLSHPHFYLQR
jgi:hypothetical protein